MLKDRADAVRTLQGPGHLPPALTGEGAGCAGENSNCNYWVWVPAFFLQNPVINQRYASSMRAPGMSKLKIVLYAAINRAGEQVVGKLLKK